MEFRNFLELVDVIFESTTIFQLLWVYFELWSEILGKITKSKLFLTKCSSVRSDIIGLFCTIIRKIRMKVLYIWDLLYLTTLYGFPQVIGTTVDSLFDNFYLVLP